MIWPILFFIAIIIFILIAALISKADPSGVFQSGERRAGLRGEMMAADIIRNALHEGDLMFTNVCVEYDGRPAELDNVIVNKDGVFIIEVKNYTGRIIGSEEDYEWRKYKITAAGYEYEKIVKNPIKQMKRQTYILAHYLEENAVRVWIRGYVMLLEGNSPVNSEYVLNGAEDVERVIHTKDREFLDEETIKSIAASLQYPAC